MKLLEYQRDDADLQSKAVLCLFQYLAEGCDESFSDKISVAPYFNGRERGYVFTTQFSRSTESRTKHLQFHIAVFQHRNSDRVCAVKSESNWLINPPTLNEFLEGSPSYYESKWNYSFSVENLQVEKMAEWLLSEFKQVLDC